MFSISGNEIINERTLTYLGHSISNENNGALLGKRIGGAQATLGTMKKMFTDKRIFLKTRVKILEACVRSRLTYGVSAVNSMKNDAVLKLDSFG